LAFSFNKNKGHKKKSGRRLNKGGKPINVDFSVGNPKKKEGKKKNQKKTKKKYLLTGE